MGIYIGIAAIAVALALILAGALAKEKEARTRWRESYYDVCRQLRDERAHSDILQEENGALHVSCERLADENLRLTQTLREYEKHGTVIPAEDRKVYFERDGIRHIFVDNEYQGWYDPEHEVAEGDD